ncbi:MAG: AAA family ATPase [Methanobrevibacter sp.]|nr:AAA family ATPase [Methanobrevibacter sp.]
MNYQIYFCVRQYLGLGKTTLAKAIVHDLGAEYIYINASSENSIDVIRNQIAEFAQTMSFSGGQKVVILDEADGLTPQFQKALRAFIEEFQSNCRFILTCNYLGKIIPALRQGRTQVFDFNMAKFKDELLPTIVKRITGILKFEKVEFDPDVVEPLCEAYFPSLRQVIATIQQYSQVYGKIDNGILSFKDVGDDLANMIVEKKKLAEIRNYVEQQGMSYTDFFKNLFDRLPTKTKNPAQVILLLAEYEFRCGTSSDPTLQMAACILELMGCV